jgi:hypothetical protein
VILPVLLSLLPLGMALGASLAPLPAGPVAAASAAGPVIRFGAFPSVVIVMARDRSVLRSRGAWLILDPVAAGGCSPISLLIVKAPHGIRT